MACLGLVQGVIPTPHHRERNKPNHPNHHHQKAAHQHPKTRQKQNPTPPRPKPPTPADGNPQREAGYAPTPLKHHSSINKTTTHHHKYHLGIATISILMPLGHSHNPVPGTQDNTANMFKTSPQRPHSLDKAPLVNSTAATAAGSSIRNNPIQIPLIPPRYSTITIPSRSQFRRSPITPPRHPQGRCRKHPPGSDQALDHRRKYEPPTATISPCTSTSEIIQ